MDEAQLGSLIGKTAALMEQFERRCEHLEQNQQVITQRLAALAEHIPGIVRQSTDNHLRGISSDVTGAARDGLKGVVNGYEQSLSQSGSVIKQQASSLQGDLKRLERLHHHLAWKMAGLLIGTLLLLVGGAVYLSMHYRNIIEQNQLSAELLQAYNRADVTLCSKQLCANIDTDAKPYASGDKQYQIVKPRK